MASKRYGVKPTEWWKHMKWAKKVMNKKLRKFGKYIIKKEYYG